MIRDRIVVGIKGPEVKDRLLREPELTLEKAISICRADKGSKKGLHLINRGTTDSTATVQLVNREAKKKGQVKDPKTDRGQRQQCSNSKCGKIHEPRSCPTYGRFCNKSLHARSKITLQICAGLQQRKSRSMKSAFHRKRKKTMATSDLSREKPPF